MRQYFFCIALLPLSCFAQNTDGDAVFNANIIHTVELTFDQPSYWDSLTANYITGVDMLAHMSFNGIDFASVGVQFKGNSSYNGPSDKKPFKIDMNEYVSGQKIDGLKKFNLNNGFKDPSFVREKLMLDFLNANGVGAPRCAYAKLYINGSYWGLYTLVEAVDKTFLDNRFNDKTGNLFKGDPQGDVKWYGSSATSYYNHYELHTNETVNDWTDLIHAVDLVNNTPATLLADSVHARFKTSHLLRAWAANNLFVNLDSYLGSGHNYYLYHDSASTEWRWITWDVNEAFGNFQLGMTVAQLQSLAIDYIGGPPNSRPLYQKALADAVLRSEYITNLCDLVHNAVDTTVFRLRADSLAAVIDDAVLTDTHKFYSYQQFHQNRTQTVSDGMFQIPGVLPFLRARIDFLNNALMMEGCITAVTEVADAAAINLFPVPADDVLWIDGATGSQTVELIDASGRTVLTSSISGTPSQVATRALSNGAYALVLRDRAGLVTTRRSVVVAH